VSNDGPASILPDSMCASTANILIYKQKSYDVYVVLCNGLSIHQVERLTFMSYYVELVL